jgi:hypothetical protein
LDFLELRKAAQAGCFLITGAAAGGGQQCEYGSDERDEDADHGSGIRKVLKKGEIFSDERCRIVELLGWGHVSWMAGSWGAWAAGSGEERGSCGDEGEFHDFNEVVFGWATA